jgi:hypothetical protein
MPDSDSTRDLNYEESKLCKVGMVQVYGRRDDRGELTMIDAFDEDEDKIVEIADRLHQVGYGVVRRRKPRAGRVYYRLQATWAGPGDPPKHPLGEGNGRR